MQIIPFRVGNKIVRTKIPEDCIKLAATIKGLNKIELSQESRQIDKDIFNIHISGWEDALLWVVKHRAGLRQSELPLDTAQLKAARPFGNFLYSMLRLAQAVLDVIDTSSELWRIKENFKLYKNAEEWFWYLCIEQELGEIFALLFPEKTNVYYTLEASDVEYTYNKETKNLLGYLQVLPNKDAKKEKMRQEIKLLRQKENPYSVSSFDGDLYRLIQISVEIAQIKIQGKNDELADVIRAFRKAWKNYIDDYEILLKRLHSGTSGSKMRHIKGDKVYERVSGKDIRVIYPEAAPNTLKIARQRGISKR